MALPTGVQSASGALNVTYNDTSSKGAYMPDGSLRVTDIAGPGIYDSSGALRVVDQIGRGVYAGLAASLRQSDADDDGQKGVYSTDGALRLNDVLDVGFNYISEDGTNTYVTENGANTYVSE